MKSPMKKSILKGICLFVACTFGTLVVQAQKSEKKKHEVTKYTVMERFEPQLILSPEERIQLKEDRVAQMQRNKIIVDTLDISERKRERLLQDIIEQPYSSRLSKTMAKLEFEDEDNQQ